MVHQLGITQIIQVSPAFPTVNDVVTIHYNAFQGNGGLLGVTPVYTHTGIITQSGLPSSWSYVQGNWGQADTNVLMTDLGNNIHEIVIDIDQYYGFPNGTNVAKLAFVFRNFDGSLEGKTATMGDIFYPIYPINGGFQAAIFKPYSDLIVNLNDTISINGQSNSNATLQLFDNGMLIADTINSTLRVFNIQEASFSVEDLYKAIQHKLGEFKIEYAIDNKFQSVADTWPSSLNCDEAKKKWKFSSSENFEKFIEKIINEMIKNEKN